MIDRAVAPCARQNELNGKSSRCAGEGGLGEGRGLKTGQAVEFRLDDRHQSHL